MNRTRCLHFPGSRLLVAITWFSLLLTTAWMAGCGSEEGGGGICTPNRSVLCNCGNNETGFQVCAADGSGFTECSCGPSTGTFPGTGGVGGVGGVPEAGTGGMAGSGGAGTGGSPPPVPVCGNGIQEAGEECDDGNTMDGDGCSAFCLSEAAQPVCGNGVVEPPEACDDGNVIDGDGCSALCAVEPPRDPNGLVPDTPHCAPVANVDASWIAFEDETLRLTNERRASPQTCGVYGSFPACGPLSDEPHLRCSARLHSKDMIDRNFFDHTNPDGLSPGDRMAAAGYTGGTWGENIYMGPTSAQEAVDGWMLSDGHCSNIMQAGYSQLGVGYWSGGGWTTQWTQNFGAAW